MSDIKEIGGYLELELNRGIEFHEKCIALNSGRNCLRYLIRARGIKKIWLPKLLCSAISDICYEEQVEVVYYSVDYNLRPVIPDICYQDDWIYLINFYGQYSKYEIVKYVKAYKRIIIDNVQAFYTKPVEGIDTLYTCRKFFGVPDGGYLYTDCNLQEDIQYDESHGRLEFLAGRFECSANDFYLAYRENEQLIDKLPLRKMSAVTHNILRGIEYEHVKNVREQNFRYLYEHLKQINRLKLSVPDGPYMYPLLIENGLEVRKKLQEKRIYVPILWPNVLDSLTQKEMEYKLVENMLPLPCDQRYDLNDMQYLLEEVYRCLS